MHNVVKWCEHRKILSMFGHFTTLCMKGLRRLNIAAKVFTEILQKI